MHPHTCTVPMHVQGTKLTIGANGHKALLLAVGRRLCVCVCVCARGCMHMCIHAHICMVSMRVHGTNPLTTDATGTGHFRLQLDFVCDPVHRVTRFDTISSLLQKHQFAVYHLTLVTWDLTPICRFSRPMKGWRNARELLIRIPRYNVDCTSTKPEKIL